MRRWLSILTLLGYTATMAQSGFEARVFTSAEGRTLPYQLLNPGGKNRPLVLFLHGAGERGSDNLLQLTHGKAFLEGLATREQAIVLVPQCPKEGYWGNVKIDRTKSPLDLQFNYSQPPTPELTNVIALLKQVIKELHADPDRIYIMGLSMGGMGTFEAVWRHPDLFAAAVPICGGGDYLAYTKKQVKIPFRVYHGTDDGVVSVNHSRNMVSRIKELRGQVIYLEIPGVNHNSWDNAFVDPDLVTWLFSQKR